MPSESEKDKIRRVYLIFRVHQDGRILQLNDGSIWDIPGESFPKVAGWHAKQRVEVEWHEGDGETHRLRNLDTDEQYEVTADLRRAENTIGACRRMLSEGLQLGKAEPSANYWVQ